MIWLNNCGTTPSSTFVITSIQEFLDGYSRNGIFTNVQQFSAVKRSIKDFLVSLLGGKSSEYSLIHNTSEGMNILSFGIELPKNSTILLLEHEYPSNYYPFQHLTREGHKIKFISPGKSPSEFMENFYHAIDDSTKLVSFSAVHWCTGMPLPLLEIGEVCHNKDIFFAVDGAQGVGHIPIDVKKMKIDFMASSAWKWLLGPLGLGILYVSEEKLNILKVPFKGTESVSDSENYLPYRDTYKEGSDRFEVSTPSFLDWVYLKSSLELLKSIGYPEIMERIYSLTEQLGLYLGELGYSLNTDHFNEKTGILVARKENIDSTLAVKFLRENGIISASRLGGIRFSPHIYNTNSQIDKVKYILSKYN